MLTSLGWWTRPPSRWLTQHWGVPSPTAAVVCTSLTADKAGMACPESVWSLRGKLTSLSSVSCVRLPCDGSIMTPRRAGVWATFRSRASAWLGPSLPAHPSSMLDSGSPCHPRVVSHKPETSLGVRGSRCLSPGKFKGTSDLLGLSLLGSLGESPRLGSGASVPPSPSPCVQARTPFLWAVFGPRPCGVC